MTIHVADFLIVAILLFGAWRGFRNGLSGEILRVAAIVAAFLISARSHVVLGAWIADKTGMPPSTARTIGFISVFAGLWGLGHLVRFVLAKLVTIRFVRPLEIGGGIAAGIIKTGAALSAVLIVVNLAEPLRPVAGAVNERSTICAFLSEKAPALYESLRERYGTVVPDPAGEEPETEPIQPDAKQPPEDRTEDEPPSPAPGHADRPADPEPEIEIDTSEPRWEPLVFEPIGDAGEADLPASDPETPR
jgi:uncharacterized membrane protein required for colicin V production